MRLITRTLVALSLWIVSFFLFDTLSAQAQVTVEYSALADYVLNPSLTKAATGDAVLMGTFAPGFNFAANQTFTSLSAAFTQFDSTTVGANSTGPGQFDNTVSLTNAAFYNKQIYIWVLNSATPSSATAWAILTNNSATWVTPATPPLSTAVDLSDPGTFVPLGANGMAIMPSMFTGAPNNTDWEMTVVPEPSTLAFAGIAVLALAARQLRRFRRS